MPTTLITGAGRGIGYALCQQYVEAAWRVIAIARDDVSATKLSSLGAEVRRLDMRDFAGIKIFATALAGEPIDVLIANAGIFEGPDQNLGELDEEWWLDAFRVNAMSPVLLARALSDNVRRSGERKMIAITSLLGSIAMNDRGGHYPYRTSKAALNAGWRALAIDVPDAIVTLVRPGRVRTRMTGWDGPLSAEESAAALRALIAKLGPADSGKFFDHTGVITPW